MDRLFQSQAAVAGVTTGGIQEARAATPDKQCGIWAGGEITAVAEAPE